MKKCFLFLIVFSILHLTACGFSSSGMIHSRLAQLNNATAEKMAQNQMDEIQSAIDAQDNEKVKTLFAPAVKDTTVLDDGISTLISLFHNQINSVERSGGSESEENNYGDKIATYAYHFLIDTKAQDYVLIIFGCTDDYRSSDNIGMTKILVMPSSWEECPDEVGDTGIFIYTE